MAGAQTTISTAELSSLCVDCGLCCGWSMFGRVRLRPEEVEWAERHRLPLLPEGTGAAFKMPCSLLQSNGRERTCGDYENRPQACRAFYCKLARGYESGAAGRADALRIIARARELVEQIGERLPGGEDARGLLDFAELRVIVRRHFFAPRPDDPASPDGAVR